MPVTVEVKTEDAAVKSHREAAAQRVINYFDLCLPDSRLLCFLDDKDPYMLREERGPENRGLYGPIHDNTRMLGWPEDVTSCIYVYDDVSHISLRVIDDLIYLYGSTCGDEVGLTMTLAHELQHAIQHSEVRQLWAVNSLIRNLKKKVIDALKLTWANIPTEVEARIVSKRVAECFFGEQRIRQYIDRKIEEPITEDDVVDWQFVRTLMPSRSVDLAGDTQLLFERLKDYKSELEEALQEKRRYNPADFSDIDLDAFFVPPSTAK
jgi:hypothetical protein